MLILSSANTRSTTSSLQPVYYLSLNMLRSMFASTLTPCRSASESNGKEPTISAFNTQKAKVNVS